MVAIAPRPRTLPSSRCFVLAAAAATAAAISDCGARERETGRGHFGVSACLAARSKSLARQST